VILQPLHISINVSTTYILVTKGIQLQATHKSEAEGEGGSERGEREETEKKPARCGSCAFFADVDEQRLIPVLYSKELLHVEIPAISRSVSEPCFKFFPSYHPLSSLTVNLTWNMWRNSACVFVRTL
jgi:hypothetical protein